MIMMWLGAMVVMVGGLSLFRWGVGQCFVGLQKRFLHLSAPVSIFKMLLTAKLCAVGQGSKLQTQYSAVALLSSRCFSKRYAVLLLCLSAAGLWTTMAGFFLAWQLSGEILLVVAMGVYLYCRWTDKKLSLFFLILGLGGFLTGAQWALQKQSILLSVLGESEFHFLLADGRFPAQLLWLGVTFVLTLVIEIESWAAVTALILLVAGSLSLNGAVAMILGEMLAQEWMLFWRSRKLNPDTQRLVRSYALASAIGLVLAFFAAGVLREGFAWSFTFAGNPLTEKSWQFLSLYVVIVSVQTLGVLIWGHFAAQKQADEVQKGEYFPVQWISKGLVSLPVFDFIFAKLKERLALLRAQKKDLDTQERARIPAAYLQAHEQEIARLALWLPLAAEKNKLEGTCNLTL